MFSVIVSLVLGTLKVMGAKKLFPMVIKVFEPDLKKWAKGTEFTQIDDNLVEMIIKVREEMEK